MNTEYVMEKLAQSFDPRKVNPEYVFVKLAQAFAPKTLPRTGGSGNAVGAQGGQGVFNPLVKTVWTAKNALKMDRAPRYTGSEYTDNFGKPAFVNASGSTAENVKSFGDSLATANGTKFDYREDLPDLQLKKEFHDRRNNPNAVSDWAKAQGTMKGYGDFSNKAYNDFALKGGARTDINAAKYNIKQQPGRVDKYWSGKINYDPFLQKDYERATKSNELLKKNPYLQINPNYKY